MTEPRLTGVDQIPNGVGVGVAEGVAVGVGVGVGIGVGVEVGVGVGVGVSVVPGSYSSAELSVPRGPETFPPATRTFPLLRRVVEGAKRDVLRPEVMLHVPVAGSYNSARWPAVS